MNSNKLSIRPLTPEDHLELVEILKTRDGFDLEKAKKRAELMNWLAFRNPSADDGESTYFVVEDNQKIVGFHGRMPNYFLVEGSKFKGYYIHDLYVDPQYRKLGKGFWLTISLAKAIEEQSDYFFCLFGMTPLNLQMQRRRKYFETNADVYWKMLVPYRAMLKIISREQIAHLMARFFAILIRLFDYLTFPRSRGNIIIGEIQRFDGSFDTFFNELAPKMGIQTYKDSEYLNWKYVNRPYKHETLFSAKIDGRISGYVILAVQNNQGYRTGKLIDIVADPDDPGTIFSLIKTSITYFRGKRVNSIHCVISDVRFKKVLRRLGFYQGKGAGGKKTVMFGNLENAPDIRNKISSIDNWHFTDSESDAEMLRF